jgi:hypothetical protein
VLPDGAEGVIAFDWEGLSSGTKASVAFPAVAFAVWLLWAVYKCRTGRRTTGAAVQRRKPVAEEF